MNEIKERKQTFKAEYEVENQD